MTALMSVGGAVLKVIGLNPADIAAESESRVPGRATYTGMDYQRTGMGEQITMLSGQTWPAIIGGMDAVAILLLQHRTQAEVPYLRLSANFAGTMLGMVIVRELSIDEGRLDPATRIGRKVKVEASLLHV